VGWLCVLCFFAFPILKSSSLVFIVSSLNAIRSYISQNAVNKSSVYGFLYAGVAIFSSLGAIVIGNIWQFYSEEKAFLFSFIGITFVIITKNLKDKNNEKVF
jgi:putative exporter of polyketide antibiotics